MQQPDERPHLVVEIRGYANTGKTTVALALKEFLESKASLT